MTTVNKPKAIALVATAVCMASLLWLMNFRTVNSTLETKLESEKLKSEALLSEKLLLEKDREKLKGQLVSLKGVNTELDDVVKKTEARMALQESQLKKWKQQVSSLSQIKKQREELLHLQKELENQLLALRASHEDLENRNVVLSNTIAQLQQQNKLLSEDLNRAMFASVDHAQMQAVKGKKERLTVRARRTQKLIADFQVPASLRNISFRIVDRNGKVLTDKEGVIASKISLLDENVVAATGETLPGNSLQRVHMEYTPKQKMQAGTYTVEILNDQLYVGSLNVKLR